MIQIMPKTEIEEVLQNIKTILSTYKGTVPLMRDFGINPNLIDQLQTESFKQKLKSEIITQIEKYEPRVKVKKTSLYTQNKTLYIKLKFIFGGQDYERIFNM